MRLRVYASADSVVLKRLKGPLSTLPPHLALCRSRGIALTARTLIAASHVLLCFPLFSQSH